MSDDGDGTSNGSEYTFFGRSLPIKMIALRLRCLKEAWEDDQRFSGFGVTIALSLGSSQFNPLGAILSEQGAEARPRLFCTRTAIYPCHLRLPTFGSCPA